MSSGKLRVVMQMSVLGLACLGVGYVTMKAVVPTPEQTYAALAPDLKRKVDASRAAREAQEQEQQRMANADGTRPVWADEHRRPR